MHMADALVSPAVGGVMLAASGACIAYCAFKSRKDELIESEKAPLMGVMSAFVFAAQMVNFTIPGTGSSGHIGGGVLLSALLGGYPGFLSLTAVLLIQALFFADGGLLALGCNIWNMGFYACLVCYPLLFAPLVKKRCTPARLMLASVLASVVSLQMGAFSVVLETLLSGVTALPFSAFLLLMQPIHLAIGLVEGVATGLVLIFVQRARPELIEAAGERAEGRGTPLRRVVIVLAVAAALIAGALSLVASGNPDGLEWSILNVTGSEEVESDGPVYDAAAAAQESVAVLPDYAFKGSDSPAGTSVSGLVGGVAALVLSGGAAWIISAVKKKRKKAAAEG